MLLIVVTLWIAPERVDNKAETAAAATGSLPREEATVCPTVEQVVSDRELKQTTQVPSTPHAYLPQEIAAALRSGKSSDKDLVLKALLPELMQSNMPAAARLAEILEPWAWRDDILQKVARGWALSDPDKAIEWAARLPTASERNVVLGQICLSLADLDPQHAMMIAQQFGLGRTDSAILENIAHHWAVKDFADALQWAERLTGGDLRDKAFARLALVRSASAPADAATLVVERISPGPIQTNSAIAVLHQWILRDPAGAASWVALFPTGEIRQRAESELAGFARYRQTSPD
jgi:hypothetical protein